ncbi:MAG: hypothetical protein ABEH58_03360 [Haloplanus sp.]
MYASVTPRIAGLGLPGLLLAGVTVRQMVRVVDACDKEALTAFGAYRGLLGPGKRHPAGHVSQSAPSPSDAAVSWLGVRTEKDVLGTGFERQICP